MIKDLPQEPLEFSFDDEDTQDSTDSDTKTYALQAKQPQPQPVVEEELSLGDVIESTPPTSGSIFELQLEDDDEDLTIISDTPPATETISTIATQPVATAETLTNETTALIQEMTHPVEEAVTAEENITEPDKERSQSTPVISSEKTDIAPTAVTPQESAPVQIPSSQTTTSQKKSSLTTKQLTNLILGVSALFLVAILFAVNFLLFVDVSSKHDMSDLTQAINQTSTPNEKRANKSAAQPSESASIIQIAPLQSEGIQGEYRFVFNKESLTGTFQVDATTPAPSPLSIEEIGRQKASPVWLKKIESQKFSFANLAPDSELKFSIPSRFYLEANGTSTRLVGQTKVALSRDSNNTVTLNYQFEIPQTGKIALPERLPTGSITFSF